MAYNSTTDNLLSNIVTNTNTLDQGDFTSLCGMIISSTGSTGQSFIIRTPQELAAVRASGSALIYEGTNISVPEIVMFRLAPVVSGSYASDLDDMLYKLITEGADSYLAVTGGSKAWIKIKKVELNYLIGTTLSITGSNTTAAYKLTAEIFNEN